MIGGSEAAAAVGLDPFKSRVRLWLEKTEQIECEEAGEAAAWGNLLQPLIAEEVSRRGYQVMPAPLGAIEHPELPFAWGHLDGFVAAASDPFAGLESYGESNGARGVFEAKTCGIRMAALWRDGKVPIPYQCQVQHYMAVTGLSWALVACLVGGQRLELREVARDDELIAMLMAGEAEFAELVKAGEPPAPDGSKDVSEMIARMYPEASGHVLLTAADMELVERRRVLKRAEKETERQLREVEDRLRLRLGAAEVGIFEAQAVVRYSNVTSHRLDTSALKAARPEVYQEFSRESRYRRLTCP